MDLVDVVGWNYTNFIIKLISHYRENICLSVTFIIRNLIYEQFTQCVNHLFPEI